MDLDHNGHTTIGLSINPPRLVGQYEHLTASVEERLNAGRSYAGADFTKLLYPRQTRRSLLVIGRKLLSPSIGTPTKMVSTAEPRLYESRLF